MKKMKKIMAAAIAMMTFSTAAAVTGTVAWFTANNIVSVNGMNVQAEVEEGIVISNEAKTSWKISAEATHQDLVSLIPTSTSDATSWYHAYSDDAENGQSYAGTHESLTVSKPAVNGTGLGTATVNNVPNKQIYLLNRFYIQSSANELQGYDIFVKDFNVTATKELSKSLRVLVKYTGASGNTTRIFEPVDGASTTYKVNNTAINSETLVTYTEWKATDAKFLVAGNINLPAYSVSGTNAAEFEVYAYFEGEDASCKSANADELEQLAISFKFEDVKHN